MDRHVGVLWATLQHMLRILHGTNYRASTQLALQVEVATLSRRQLGLLQVLNLLLIMQPLLLSRHTVSTCIAARAVVAIRLDLLLIFLPSQQATTSQAHVVFLHILLFETRCGLRHESVFVGGYPKLPC